MSLPVSRLVVVNVSLSPTPAASRTFGDLLIVGDSNVISGLERIRDYSNITDVGQDFSTNAPEYLAAETYFEQKPTPLSLSIGRWLRTATAAILQGAILTVQQQLLNLFTAITNGGFDVTIDGTAKTLTALNFSAQSNLNGVATVITTALSGSGTCTWNGSEFIITSATTGIGVEASGTITFSGNPTAADTVTVNGTAIEFVASGATGNEVNIGTSDTLTAVNLLTFLQTSQISNLTQCTYSLSGLVLTVTAATPGTAGNSITLAKSSSVLAISGGDLAGGTNPSSVSYATSPSGSYQDVSILLGLTAAVALPLVPGYAAESPLQAIVALDAISTEWYGSMFAASVQPTDNQNIAIFPFIEADQVTRTFGVTIQNTNVLSSEVSNDLASEMAAGGYEQSFCQYSSSNPYAVASMFGRAFSVNFEGTNTMIDLMYKQEPGVTAEALTTDQANTLQAKRCNVYVGYDNDTSILQYGVMSGPAFFDEIYGIDWLQDKVQTNIFNVNFTSPTKVPQTDSGMNQYTNAIASAMQQGVDNGFGAPGIWNGPAFGQLSTGQYLKLGYYIYNQPVALQSESDRAARESPPFTAAFKLAGSNQMVNLQINVNP